MCAAAKPILSLCAPVLLAAMLFLAACAGNQSRPAEADALPTASLQPAVPTEGSRHALALEARDMNAALANPLYRAVRMRAQTPVDLHSKAISSWAAGLASLPQPAELKGLAGSAPRGASEFAEDDLILDGSAHHPYLDYSNVTDGAEPENSLSFDCATNPSAPLFADSAYATWRFVLEGYAASGKPQTVGVLWTEDDSPSRYYIGLSNWGTARWDWFEGSADDVISTTSLAPYIDGDNQMLVVVIVLDSEPRGLELVQVGAQELRGLGGEQTTVAEELDFASPELYYPGKSASNLSGAPSEFQLWLEAFGYVSDQGDSLACTCCAVAGAYNYELHSDYEPYWDSYRFTNRMSPKWIYLNTYNGLASCNVGRTPEAALDCLMYTGAATEANAPYNTNCTLDWSQQACDMDKGYLRIDNWRKIRSQGQTGIDEIKYTLTQLGHPVIMLVTVDGNFLSGDFTQGDIWFWNDWVPNVLNWHTMLITGYSDSKSAFYVRNSWGADWGQGGDVWISYDNFMSGPWIDCFYLWDHYDQGTADYYGVSDSIHALSTAEVRASDGSFADKVVLDWDAVPFATSYDIYCDTKDNLIGSAPGDTTEFTDYSLSDDYAHNYWVQTWVNGSASPIETCDIGYLMYIAPFQIQEVRGESSGKPGQVVVFSFGGYNPYPAGSLDASWDFPAGSIVESSPLTSRMASVTFKDPGTYTVTLTVTNDGGPASTDFSLTVLPLPQAPVAGISGPSSYRAKKPVYFSGAASTAFGGEIIRDYLWDWNGDFITDETTTGPDAAHIFSGTGIYPVRLRVRDSKGLLNNNSACIVVNITPYDEIEPNDTSAQALSSDNKMAKRVSYKGSLGSRAGYDGYDADYSDWWYLPVQAENVLLTVNYKDSYIGGLKITAWDDDLSLFQEGFGLGSIAYTWFPPMSVTNILVEVAATSGGGDYYIQWDMPAT